jgi:hypothetical protein
MQRFIRALTIERLVIAVTFIGVFVIAVHIPLDTDTFWHLRAGQWQVQERALLRVDLFSHTRQGQPWINHSWLSQLVLYTSYAALGDLGLALYTAILATLGMAFVYPQCEGNAFVRGFALVLGAATAAVFWSPRPQMMSFALSAVVLYLVWRDHERPDRGLWLIPPIMLVWANLHGGWVIGFIVMALALAGDVARFVFDRLLARRDAVWATDQAPTLHSARRLFVIALASAVAVSVNPYGPSMLTYPFRTVGIGVLRDYIQEWASPNFHERQVWPFLWLLLGTLGVAGLSRRRLDWRDALMVTGTAYLSLLAGRNIALFAIVTTPVLTRHLGAWLGERGWTMRLDRFPTTPPYLVANWAMLLLVGVAGVAKVVYALDPALVEEERAKRLPVEAVAYLEEAHPPGLLFNSYNWGGYLIWEAPDYPVFVDGRTDLYDDELLRLYLEVVAAQDDWKNMLDRGDINLVLIESRSPLAVALSLEPGWRIAYRDDLATIFVREVPLGDE